MAPGPAVHYRIANEQMDAFADNAKYETKEEAEAAANTQIIGQGGPSALYIYALAAKVTVATEAVDAV